MNEAIWKWKSSIKLRTRGPYEAGHDSRVFVRHESGHLAMSVPDAAHLYLEVGKYLGMKEKALKKLLDQVPYADRPII